MKNAPAWICATALLAGACAAHAPQLANPDSPAVAIPDRPHKPGEVVPHAIPLPPLQAGDAAPQ
ncbi:hypothetical protein [Amphibiibacter pelophylacis]|uniref:Uncharacterized protein n=1 Tax=Amphibiibacter pelophylacis TaxID=1799477 RepID=A0ACC6P4Q1_9BURK